MRKVNGGDIAKNELKKCWFGFSEKSKDDFSDIVEYIEIENSIFGTNEEETMFVRFPKNGIANIEEDWFMVDAIPKDEEITVYDFIEGYYGLDECYIEDFTFYFAD